MSKNDFIEKLRQENTDFPNERMAKNLANSLNSLSSDIFTEYIRFVFELIQNADDAEALEININIQDKYFIVSHNGKAFDQKDVEAICSIGEGTKNAEENKTGYKGIGFKSVFGKSKNVTIFSNGFQFRFDNSFRHPKFPETKMPWQIIPVWTNENELPKSAKSIVSNGYNVSTVIELKNTNGLQNDLNELLSNGKILLFLRRITKISVSINGEHNFTIEKSINNKEKYFDEVSLLKNNKEDTQWIVTTFEKIQIDAEAKAELGKDDKTPDKLKKAEFTEISFAARIEKGRIKSLKGEESLVFTYLPTKVIDFEFPFLVNGNFLTNASREAIHEDRFWNKWLFEIIGIKIFDWLELLTSSKYKFQILHLLPSKFNSLQNKLKISFDNAFEKSGTSKIFVPNKNNKLKKASDILIDKTGLSGEEFISTESLIGYINREKDKHFNNDAFIHSKIELKGKLKSLGATTFDIENLEDFFIDDVFKANHQPEQNYFLIKYFYKKSNTEISSNWNDKLHFIPFIYAKGKSLRSPREICFPSKGDLSELEKDVKIIHTKVFNDLQREPAIIDWLRNLGVNEVSEIKWLENEILPNISNLDYEKDYLNITNSIYYLYEEDLLKDWHYSQLCEFKILCKDGIFRHAKDCYLSNYYLPEVQLEKIYKRANYVDKKYCINGGNNKNKFKSFLVQLQVAEDISLYIHKADLSWGMAGDLQYTNFIDKEYNNGTSNWDYHNGGVVSDSHAFRDFIEFSMMSNTKISYDFAILFWDYILSKNSYTKILSNDILLLHGYSRNQVTYVKNYINWYFNTQACFPTKQDKLMKASDTFINTNEIVKLAGKYLPVFACDTIPNDEWFNLIPFKHDLGLEDYLSILVNISEDLNKDDKIKTINKRRIGLIYNKLTELLQNLSSKKKNQITEWAEENKLLSSTEVFENANELKWIKISGFSNTSDRLKTIFIPDNCNTDSEYFEELLSLFGIQVIDRFIPEIKDAEPNATLKIQLQIILPYLVALIEKKQYANYADEYNRISKIIDSTEFYNSSKINLSFKNQEEIISGPSLYVYIDNKKLYFTGKLESQLTLYALVPELVKLLEIKHLNEELKLLLQSTVDDIKEWLNQIGIDYYAIPIKVIEKSEKISSTNISVVNSNITTQNVDLNKLLSEKNITLEQLLQYIENLDADEFEENIGFSSTNHLAQKGKNEENRVARELVYKKLINEGYEFTKGSGENSVINGVFKDGIEYPLVVKSYRNSSYKFNIRPNEWLQLSKENSMFWVHRGNGKLEYLKLEGLLRANSDFHVQFETSTFSFEGLAKFAEVFRFVKNVHFQLDAPNFSMAKAFEEYQFDKRKKGNLETDSDNQELLH